MANIRTIPKVTNVEVRPPWAVPEFDDGVMREVDLSDELWGGRSSR